MLMISNVLYGKYVTVPLWLVLEIERLKETLFRFAFTELGNRVPISKSFMLLFSQNGPCHCVAVMLHADFAPGS